MGGTRIICLSHCSSSSIPYSPTQKPIGKKVIIVRINVI